MRAEQTITVRVVYRPWVMRAGLTLCRAVGAITPRRWHAAIVDGLVEVVVRFGTVVTVVR